MTHTELAGFLQQAAHYPAYAGRSRNVLFAHTATREAAVLLGVVKRGSEWQILLTRRNASLPEHAGQIALAGGRKDEEDASLTHTALRETAEETGIGAEHWQTFPQFQPYYTPSGYIVSPVPALCSGSPPTFPNAAEVAEIFYLPLSVALDTQCYENRTFTHNGRRLDAPALPYLHYDIWGLTAMILYDLADRYRQYRQLR